jgi:hypothetical protein
VARKRPPTDAEIAEVVRRFVDGEIPVKRKKKVPRVVGKRGVEYKGGGGARHGYRAPTDD